MKSTEREEKRKRKRREESKEVGVGEGRCEKKVYIGEESVGNGEREGCRAEKR